MKIINFKEFKKGMLQGFFDVYIDQWGMTISCSLFEKHGQRWVNLPGTSYEKDGQTKFKPLVKFTEEKHKKFQEKILELIDKKEYEVFVPREPKESKKTETKPLVGSAPTAATSALDECPF